MISCNDPIQKLCKRCNVVTRHRMAKDKRRPNALCGYYACSVCLERANLKHRKLNWTSYLAQKANARKRENSIKLKGSDLEALALMQNNKCFLTNVEFDLDDKWYRPSLDRIDSSKGYTLDNIRLLAWIVNHCRGSLSDSDFIQMCQKVSDHSRGII